MGIRKLFGIELPIVQAPMAGVQDHRLAAAVSNAGGLGSLPCALLTPEQIRSELSALRRATDKPFSVNFFCHSPPDIGAERARLARWQAILAPYGAEYDTAPAAAPSAPGPGTGSGTGPDPVPAPSSSSAERRPFDEEAAELLSEFEPPVVSFHFGLPEPSLLDRVRAWGAKVISSATTVEEALWLQARGVDAVIAQGAEAGGHRGMFLATEVTAQPGTFALVPQVVEAVDVPVIAAGGIADARGVRAALTLGAAGVQVGTAYLLCPEATTKPLHRRELKGDGARNTAITNVFTGRPARSIVNRAVRELGPLHPDVPAFPLAAGALAPLRAGAEAAGSSDFTPLWAGQNVSGCREIPAAELTRQLAAGPGSAPQGNARVAVNR